ncbi:MAG: hypothetical protein HC923_04130 [Myxococcales bacterium]|nr:hypothetical protein [Myxococcales bacterium]
MTGAGAPTSSGVSLTPHLDESRAGDAWTVPVAQIFGRIARARETGFLDVHRFGRRRRVYVIEGSPCFVQSSHEGEDVATLLFDRGRITDRDFQRCQNRMQRDGATLQDALLSLRLVDESELLAAYCVLSHQLLERALGSSAVSGSGRAATRSSGGFLRARGIRSSRSSAACGAGLGRTSCAATSRGGPGAACCAPSTSRDFFAVIARPSVG